MVAHDTKTPIVRRLTHADIDASAHLNARTFAAEGEYEQFYELTRLAHQTPFMPPELAFGVEEDGRIVAKFQILPLQLRVGSALVRCGGLQGVAAESSQYGSRYGTLLFQGSVAEAFTLGFDAGIGFAERGSRYVQSGARPICAEYLIELDARRIAPLGSDVFRPMVDADVPRIIEHYNRGNLGRSASAVRAPEMWPFLLRRPPEVWVAKDGYLGVRRNLDNTEVREVAGESTAFYDAAIRKLAELARANKHDKITGHLPIDHPFVHMAAGYGVNVRVDYSRRAGCLGIVASPVRFLAAITPDLQARLERSKLAGHRVRVIVSGAFEEAEALLSPGKHGAQAQALDLRLAVAPGVLLQLAVGYRPACALLESEGLRPQEAFSETERTLLDILFPSGHPFFSHTDRF